MADTAREKDKAEHANQQPGSTITAAVPTEAPSKTPEVQDDSDPDFDDLDDVLDQFAANAPSKKTESEPPSQPQPSASGPGRPLTETALPIAPNVNESEDDFLNRLAAEMSAMLPSISNDPAVNSTPEAQAKMAAELEALTHKMEADGMKPEDLLKMVFGAEEGARLAQEAAAQDAKADPVLPSASASASTARPTSSGPTTFEDTIRRTMSRLDQSDTQATNATAQSSSKAEEDLLAEMLKNFESGQGGDEDGLSKMFLDMMQQLTHKDVLYEPMKELNDQYPSWLNTHQPPQLEKEEYERYKRQSTIVADIVSKFEEPGFSDDNAECREYIWEKMQQMQGEGAPPEDLVKNPFPGTDFGGIPGLGGGADGDGKGPEEGCPTQ